MLFNVVQNQLLTPNSTTKAVYELTLTHVPPINDLLNSASFNALAFSYQPGDWLAVTVSNHVEAVNLVLNTLQLRGDEPITLRSGLACCARQALCEALEITRLNPAILNKMQRELGLGAWPDRQAMMAYASSRDVVDLLTEFPSLVEMGVGFLSWLSPLAPRFYSIASAPCAPNITSKTDGCTLSIIYKLVQYKGLTHPHFGVATRYLSGLRVGDVVKAEVKSNPNFKLPSDMSTPIIMVGAGTGLAPFMGFMQQRIQDAQNALTSEDLDGMAFNDMPNSMLKSALNPARNMLFWGDAYQHTDCVKCADLHGWVAAKELVWFAAFSRDQAQKIYVQDVLWQQRELVWQQWQNGAVLYVCGSQTTMAKAVEQTWRAILQSLGGLSQMDADQAWLNAKRQKRIQLDVY